MADTHHRLPSSAETIWRAGVAQIVCLRPTVFRPSGTCGRRPLSLMPGALMALLFRGPSSSPGCCTHECPGSNAAALATQLCDKCSPRVPAQRGFQNDCPAVRLVVPRPDHACVPHAADSHATPAILSARRASDSNDHLLET